LNGNDASPAPRRSGRLVIMIPTTKENMIICFKYSHIFLLFYHQKRKVLRIPILFLF
jgi:hypothetical protein